jgi:hypothetical protein
MNVEQKQAVYCAYLDLIGVLEAQQKGLLQEQDWNAVWHSLNDLYTAFSPLFANDEHLDPMFDFKEVVDKPEA